MEDKFLIGKSLNGVKKIVGKIRNSQAFWILITGFHRMIHYLLVFFTVESYLVRWRSEGNRGTERPRDETL